MQQDDVRFERMISHHPKLRIKGEETEQPTLRDMVFDYYCKIFMDDRKADAATKAYIEAIYSKHGSYRGAM